MSTSRRELAEHSGNPIQNLRLPGFKQDPLGFKKRNRVIYPVSKCLHVPKINIAEITLHLWIRLILWTQKVLYPLDPKTYLLRKASFSKIPLHSSPWKADSRSAQTGKEITNLRWFKLIFVVIICEKNSKWALYASTWCAQVSTVVHGSPSVLCHLTGPLLSAEVRREAKVPFSPNERSASLVPDWSHLGHCVISHGEHVETVYTVENTVLGAPTPSNGRTGQRSVGEFLKILTELACWLFVLVWTSGDRTHCLLHKSVSLWCG